MKFVLAITTYNRLPYLKRCVDSWKITKSKITTWTLIIADDGSTDGTIEYLDQLDVPDSTLMLIKNKRIGVHQQVNTILAGLDRLNFDFCFKVDDDIFFKKAGWDIAYYETAMKSGYHHLVYCDSIWAKEQQKVKPTVKENLVSAVGLFNIQGHFYTITPDVLQQVGYFDVDNFGFRGMGHVDYTARCARKGFTDIENPWDLKDSMQYFESVDDTYQSALPAIQIAAYDELNRERKTEIIKNRKSAYVPYQEINHKLWDQFQKEVLEALSIKAKNAAKEKMELEKWYRDEIKKTQEWYQQKINNLPNWYIALGNKLFRK